MTTQQHCGWSGKVCFSDRSAAVTWVRERLKSKGTVYRCPLCEQYHITRGVRGKPRRKR